MEKAISKFIEENKTDLLEKGWLNDFKHLVKLESILIDLKNFDLETVSELVKFLGYEKITKKYHGIYKFIFDHEDEVLYVEYS